MEFFKYQSLGNDFILLDWFSKDKSSLDHCAGKGGELFPPDRRPREGGDPFPVDQLQDPKWPTLVASLCNRHFGIGSDGVLVIIKDENLNIPRVLIYNSDGSKAEACFNGIRCVANHLVNASQVSSSLSSASKSSLFLPSSINTSQKGSHALPSSLPSSPTSLFSSPSSLPSVSSSLRRQGSTSTSSSFDIAMGSKIINCKVINTPSGEVEVETNVGKSISIEEKTIEIDSTNFAGSFVNVGNPHFVVFQKVSLDWLRENGSKLETHKAFPNKANIEFVWKESDQSFYNLLVFERGCGITLACSTGAAAVMATLLEKGLIQKEEKISIKMPGGLLTSWLDASCNVMQKAISSMVFTGCLL